MSSLTPLLGLIVFLALAWTLSENRKIIDAKLVIWGLALQVGFAILVLGIPRLGVPGLLHPLFELINSAFIQISAFSDKGSQFVFGWLADDTQSKGFIFAFRVLPTIIFFSSLVAVLYYCGILQKVVGAFAFVMRKTLKTSGPETLSTAANIFLGQTEAPLMIKPYLPTVTRSELHCIMVGGFANVAGSVLAAFVMLLHGRFPDIAGHLLTVSVMSAPATLVIAKIMIPEMEKPKDVEKLKIDAGIDDANVIEAATRGASEGLSLALNVGAMLIAFIAMIALINGILGFAGGHFGFDLSLQKIFGYAFSPLAFLMGVPWGECLQMGRLLGEKIVLNEFVAYMSLADLGSTLSDRTMLIASYALCGFANFSSIGIQVGGIGAMAPSRRKDLARLGLKAMIAGNLATFTCACIVAAL